MAFVITLGSMARRMMKGELGSEKRAWMLSRTLRTFLCSTLSRPSTTTMSISFSRLTFFLTALRKPSELITSCLVTDGWRGVRWKKSWALVV